MKAQELRIGNWVMFDNRIFQIDSIAIVFPTLNTDEFGIGVVDWNNIKPVTLTEEWLLRFGFSSKYKSCHTKWNILGFDLDQKSDENDDGNKIPQEQVFYFNYQYDIKSVHQLQNLYFALTGEELTLKENTNGN